MTIFEKTTAELPNAKRFDIRIDGPDRKEHRSYDLDELRENEKFLERRRAEECRIRIADADARENAIEFKKEEVRVLKALHEPMKKKAEEPDREKPAIWESETLEEKKKRHHSRPVDPEWERPDARLELRPPMSGAEAEAVRNPIRDRAEQEKSMSIEFERS